MDGEQAREERNQVMMPQEAINIRDEALRYYDNLGWFVLPAKGKVPQIAWKPYGDQRPSREETASWEAWDQPNIQVAARTGQISGMVLLDCDSEEAWDYVKSKGHPATPFATTGRGRHLYFQAPDFRVSNAVNLAGREKLDLRGDGGIVVVPPSPHSQGRWYEWVISPWEALPAEMPPWLYDLLLEHKEHRKGPLDTGYMMAGLQKGERDDYIWREIYRMRKRGWSREFTEEVALKVAKESKPPFPTSSVLEKVERAFTEHHPDPAEPILVTSPSPPSDNGHKTDDEGYLLPVVLGECEKPGPRQWVVDRLIPARYPTTLYGTGGVSKSYIALTLATAVAAGHEEWMGFPIKNGPVLYLDFELEVQEQTRRAYQVAEGMGMEKPPKDLLYLSASEMRMVSAFKTALHWCKKYGVVLIIIDSTGLALEGDSESAKDVIAFFREVVGQFVAVEACPLLVDHQAKVQSSDSYQGKTAFGSGYKEYLSRSAIQVELIRRGEGTIDVRFYQKKTNFGPAVEPFDAKVKFLGERVEVERIKLDDSELATVEILGAEERVKSAVRYLGDAVPYEVAELSGLALATAKKQFTILKKRGELVEEGSMRDGARVMKMAGPTSLEIPETRETVEAEGEYWNL